MDDLRAWLVKLEGIGAVKTIKGLSWDLEIGAAMSPGVLGNEPQAILFDDIAGYPQGYRILTGALKVPAALALCLGLPPSNSIPELIQATRKMLPKWETDLCQFPPRFVKQGPILENVDSGGNIDLFKFPVPRWHEYDGGRYIGTADSVITRDPDTGEINLGTYRIMVHDRKTTALYISPGKHGRMHYEKYHAQGKACPVAISVGHHPLVFAMSRSTIPFPEYNYMGAIAGEPVDVIEEEVTGLPIPAQAEIVIAGWCPPGKARIEGPFGEWTGYYASLERPAPIVEVECVYYRNNPIILGSSPRRPPGDNTAYETVFLGSQLHNQLERMGLPDVKGVWISDLAGQMLIVVSIRQRYGGHARQVLHAASQGSSIGAYMGRYVIVVDDDIDPTNVKDVLWAVCTRSDPGQDFEIIRRAWSTPLDPTIRKPTQVFMNSRGLIDACRPFEWIDEFPRVIDYSPDLTTAVKHKLGMES